MGQKLNYHVHLHFIVTAGGLSRDGERWLEPRHGQKFLFPVEAMSLVMRGKFMQKLEQAYENGELKFEGQIAGLAEPGAFKHFLRQLARKTFYIYSKPPFRQLQKNNLSLRPRLSQVVFAATLRELGNF